jgi:hypothetical protein
MRVSGNFELYRDLTHQTTSLEATARLEAGAFPGALEDPRTIRVQHGKQTLPFALPIDTEIADLSWVHTAYFQSYFGTTDATPVYTAVLPPGGHDVAPESRPLLDELAQQEGILLVEYPSSPESALELVRGTKAVTTMLGRIGLTAADLSKPSHRHFHYLNRLTPSDQSTPMRGAAWDTLHEACAQAKEAFPDVSTEVKMAESDIAAVWKFYESGHKGINKFDPLSAGFKRDELTAVLTDERILKFISRRGATILNIALIADPVRSLIAGLVNQSYLREHYPNDYRTDNILFSPGIVRNHLHPQGGSSSIETIGCIGTIIRRANIAPILGYACNLTSNKIVPKLAQTIFPQQGLDVSHPEPVSEQTYGIYRLGRAG